MRNLLFLVLILSVCTLTSCDSHSEDIGRMEKRLLYENKGERGVWITEYTYDFVEGIKMLAKEQMTLEKNGEFKEEITYYYEGTPLAKSLMTGTWEIEYDDDLDTYFFNQYFNDNIEIKNINMSSDWFKRFDTDVRLRRKGDAYDMILEDSDDTLYGNEIIDCSDEIFLIKDLEDDSAYRYEKSKN